jgi:hypothetical protein
LDARSYAGRSTYLIEEWSGSKGPNLDVDDDDDDDQAKGLTLLTSKAAKGHHSETVSFISYHHSLFP